jgi:predicted O-methyltransferase YrrM
LTSADAVLREIEKMTEEQFLPIVGPRKGNVLTEIIREYKPKRILEVGTLIGYSTIFMAKELEKTVCIITIENHAAEAEVARENIARAQVTPSVEVIVGDAIQVIPELTCVFDMALVDAEKTEYFAYLKLMEPKLREGSVIVADNAGIFADEMENYLRYVQTPVKYTSKYVHVGEDGLEISVKL